MLLDTGTITKDDLWVSTDSTSIVHLFSAPIFATQVPSECPVAGTKKRKLITGMGLEENATKVGGRNWNWVRKRIRCWFRLAEREVCFK